MKKVLFTVLSVALLGSASVFAQGFAKGDVFVSGAIGYASENNKNTNTITNTFAFAPSLNYFVTENISIGGKIGYASEVVEVSGTDFGDEKTFTLGAVGRYYLTPADQFSLFGQLGAEYMSTKENVFDEKENGFGAELGLGLNYFLSEKFSIEAGVAVLGFSSTKPDGGENISNFAIGGNLTDINFGVNYKF